MKKKALLSEAIWVFEPDGPEMAPAVLSPAATSVALVIDEGEPLPLVADAGGVTDLTVAAAKPVASIAQLADYLVNGFWQYNGTIAHRFVSSTITYNINALNSAEQFLAVSAMQAWHDIANINFVQSSGVANLTFSNSGSMQAYTSAAWNSSGAIAYANIVISSDWIMNDGGAYDGKTGIDSYGYQTYVHEIGHALGLGHQGPYNGSASYSTNAIYANDTWQYSIMSYFSEPNYSGGSYRYVVTPQMADIYAVGSMYGAATSTRTADTVYGFNSNAGAVFNFSGYTSAPALTIYDSGGNDTLDCSGYSSAQTIDLHPGAFSSVGGLVNNIGIALNAVIEKAIGGSGNDRLIASDAGSTLVGGGGNDTQIGGTGSDKLFGGSGVDILTGGSGADTFVFLFGDSSAGSGQHDRITDFLSGTDHIDLSGYDAISSTGIYDQFKFIASTAFHGVAGELNYFHNSSSGVTTLQGDTNGDGFADFGIDFTGNISINQADLMGIALVPVVIEALGTTTLVEFASNYYLYAHGAASGPTLKYGGSIVSKGQFGNVAPIAVEQTANGYQIVWKVDGADQFNTWNLDGNGNHQSYTAAVSGSSTALKSLETSFQQDLNGDGVIGGSTTGVVIEAFGAMSLVVADNTYHFGGASGTELKYGGSAVAVGQFSGKSPIAVEQTANGYQVAWKVDGADLFNVWYTDGNGNYQSYTPVVTGSSAALKSFETSFQQDLNGDGVVGGSPTGVVIEAFGATSLVLADNTYHFGSAGGPELKYNGTAVVFGQFDSAVPIAVEKTANGYQVVWKVSGADLFNVWYTDGNGNYQSYTPVVSGNSAALKSFEASLQQDLNGDGVINGSTISQAVLASVGLSILPGSQHQDELAMVSNSMSDIVDLLPVAGIFSDHFFWLPVDNNADPSQAAYHGLAVAKMHVNEFHADSLIFV